MSLASRAPLSKVWILVFCPSSTPERASYAFENMNYSLLTRGGEFIGLSKCLYILLLKNKLKSFSLVSRQLLGDVKPLSS